MKQSILTKGTYTLVSSAPDAKLSTLEDDALQDGIQFQAKFIGSMEVVRPTNRMEIVAAMRTIRYEFKEKGIKKIKIDVSISTDGVSITKRSKAKLWKWRSVDDGNGKLIMQHPVHRIFYVSHDSQDLQIFSYIACDSDNVFNCHVFKASNKSGAIHLVRTIGRVFDVCHRLNQQKSNPDANVPVEQKKYVEVTTEQKTMKDTPLPDAVAEKSDLSEIKLKVEEVQPTHSTINVQHFMLPGETPTPGFASSCHSELILRQQLQLESLRSQQLVSEVQLVQSQLTAETAARINLQLRVQQLIQQNQRLLNYIGELAQLVKQLNENDSSNRLIDLEVSPKESSLSNLTGILSTLSSHCLQNDSVITSLNGLSAISPDSGLREMFSEGGSVFANTPNDTSWYSALAATTLAASVLNCDESLFDRSDRRPESISHSSTVNQDGFLFDRSNGRPVSISHLSTVHHDESLFDRSDRRPESISHLSTVHQDGFLFDRSDGRPVSISHLSTVHQDGSLFDRSDIITESVAHISAVGHLQNGIKSDSSGINFVEMAPMPAAMVSSAVNTDEKFETGLVRSNDTVDSFSLGMDPFDRLLSHSFLLDLETLCTNNETKRDSKIALQSVCNLQHPAAT